MSTLWYGGNIYTMRSELETVEALLVKDKKVYKAGTLEVLRNQYSADITEEIDLAGKTMYPGFVDSHLHLIGHGEKLLRLDLSKIRSADMMKTQIVKHMATIPEGEWVIGEGWDENKLVDRKIFTRQELDEISPDQPLLLKRICRHAVLVNTKALQLAGIDEQTENPSGGVIVRDETGEATGLLLDEAQELVKKVIPQVTESYIKKSLALAVADVIKHGLVGAHTEDLNYYGGFKRTFEAFLQVSGRLKLNLLVHHEAVAGMVEAGYGCGEGTANIQLGAMKIFADGALGGRTALLSEPYSDAPALSGVAIHETDELRALVARARANRMPVAIHAIGDLALEYAIDVIEAIPPKSKHQRDRIIHAQVARKDLIERMSGLPLIVDIQPGFVASDFPWVIERLGPKRMTYAYAWKTLLDHEITCAGGSDAPIEDVSPLLGIHAAVVRRNVNEAHEGYMPEQKLSVFEAVRLYTVGSAKAINMEQSRGMIAEGYEADFTVLDQDLFKIDHDDILLANVEMTVIDGEVLYRKGDSS